LRLLRSFALFCAVLNALNGQFACFCVLQGTSMVSLKITSLIAAGEKKLTEDLLETVEEECDALRQLIWRLEQRVEALERAAPGQPGLTNPPR
jgi:hypothetical protein